MPQPATSVVSWSVLLTLFLIGGSAPAADKPEAGKVPPEKPAAEKSTAEKAAAVVGPGTAHLAVRPDDQSAWRLVEQGEPLPASCQIRSAGSGVRMLRTADLRLLVEGGATLRLDATSRRIELQAGRTLVAGEPQDDQPAGATVAAAPWRIAAGPVQAEVAADTRSVWSRTVPDRVEVDLLAGALKLQADEARIVAQPVAPSAATFDATKKSFSLRPLAPPDQRRLESKFPAQVAPQGLGQLVVADAQSGTAQRLDVARYHVNVVLQPPVALVQIDQSFYNPYPQSMEGTFVFNLPAGAAVSRFAMYVTPEQLIEGELVERQRANQVYTSIVTTRRDPAILEEIGANLFKMRVFPIFARDSKRILLDYTVPLEPQGAQYRFRLPLFSDLKPIWDFSVTGRLNGEVQFDSLKSPTHSQLEFRREATQATWKWEERDYRPQSDLLLSFRGADERRMTMRSQKAAPLPASAAPAVALPRGQNTPVVPIRDPRTGIETTYFQLTAPASLAFADAAAPPADVLLLVDTSEFARQRTVYDEQARAVLRHLRPTDRVRTAVVDVNHRWLHDDWMRGGSPQAEQILSRLAEQYALGRSAPSHTIAAAVRDAFGAAASQDDPAKRLTSRRRVVLWLGEGWETGTFSPARVKPAKLPGGAPFQFLGDPISAQLLRNGNLAQVADDPFAGPRNPKELAGPIDAAALVDSLREFNVRLTALVTDSSLPSVPNAYSRLAELTSGTGGRMFDAHAAADQAEFYEWLLAGFPESARIESLEVDGALADDLLYSKSWFPGRPLRIYGRAEPNAKLALRMTVRRDGQAFELKQNFEPTADDALFVGRTWAQRRIASWRAAEPADANVREQLRLRTIGLSQEWSVLSPHTAFLVLETEIDYARWNIDRTVRRKYWKPQGAEPTRELPAEWLARLKKDRNAAKAETQRAVELSAARRHLDRGEFAKAYWELNKLVGQHLGDQQQEVERLRREAEAGLAREAQVRQVAREFSIFAPTHRPSSLRPSWSRYVLPVEDATTELPGSRFAKQLARTIRIEDMPKRSIADLARWVEATTGVTTDLDRRSLEAEAVGTDTEVEVVGRGELSIGGYLRFVAAQLLLVVVEEPDRLLLTSREEDERRMSTEIYPIDDLLLSEGGPTPGQLRFGSAEARRDAAAVRLREKLRAPVSFELAGATLRSAVEHLADTLGAPIVLDVRSLEAEGIGSDSPLDPLRIRGVPAGTALRRVLRGFNLTYAVRDEAIVVLTREEAEDVADTRVYPGRDLVHLAPIVPQQIWNYNTQPPTVQTGWLPNGIWPRGTSRDVQRQPLVQGWGYGGGMGGGGMGGMGGGMFGGPAPSTRSGGGTFGGPSNAASPPAADPAAVSNGGDGQTPAPPTRDAAPNNPPVAVAASPEKPAALKPPRIGPDPDPILELVQRVTGRPDPDWVDNGGVGEIAYFDPTFDFAIRTTEEVHEQVASLFERLAKLPKSGLPPAQASAVAPRIGREELDLINWQTLMNFFMSTVGKPNPGWEDEGGVNVIEPDRARLALVVSATQKSHEQFHTLLTRLRRSRYEAKHHARPWEIDQLLPFGDVAERTTKPVERPATQVPDAELARLAVRRVPQEGRWQGERREAGARPRPLAIALGAGRVEFTAPNWIVRYDDRQAAEAHPDLGSVVLHRDIDAIRRRLDDELPWWPHRSNEELAKLYRVDDVPGEGDDRVAVLRLTPRVSGVAALANVSAPQKPGASKQGASKPVAAGPSVESAPIAFLKATFARDTGRLLRYEIHLEGRRLATLELAAAAAAGEKSPPLAVLLDASGRRLVEWRTVARDPAAKPDAAEPPPAVDAGWNDYLALDRRSPRPALDAEYHAIVTAMARGEWRVAFERLQVAVAARPERPLLRMLRGVCALNDRSLAPRPQALADLQTAAASSADGIARALATQSQFEQHLAPRELFDILSRQEEARRSLDVTLRLARLAQELDDRATALRHARRAVAQLAEGDQSEADSSETYANRRLVVELLLLGGQTDEARQAARAALADGRATIGQILMFADVFAQQKLAPIAVEVVQSQLAARTWNSAERYRLLRRAADYAEGFARVQLLFDALRTPAQGVAEQAADIDLLWMSISTADEAARLLEQLNARPVVESKPNGKPDDAEGEPAAAPSADAALLVRLLYVRAVLTTDVAESGRALLVALEKGPIPERWEDTVLGRLLEARQIGPCVAWYERQLRDGRSLEAAHRSRFAQALRQLGRDREAARVQ